MRYQNLVGISPYVPIPTGAPGILKKHHDTHRMEGQWCLKTLNWNPWNYTRSKKSKLDLCPGWKIIMNFLLFQSILWTNRNRSNGFVFDLILKDSIFWLKYFNLFPNYSFWCLKLERFFSYVWSFSPFLKFLNHIKKILCTQIIFNTPT